MTNKAKQCVQYCREWYQAFANKGRGDEPTVKEFLEVADLIESLTAELERVTKAHDAAVKHLLECHKTICPTCIHHTGAGCDKNANAGVDEAVIFCVDYEWCGFEM